MVFIRAIVEQERDLNGNEFDVVYYVWRMTPIEAIIFRGLDLPDNEIIGQEVAEDILANDPNNFHYNYVFASNREDELKYTTKEIFEEIIRMVENELNLIREFDIDELNAPLPELPENR